MWDLITKLGDTQRRDARRRAHRRSRSCSGCGASRRASPARSSPCCSASPRSRRSTSTTHGVEIVGHIDGGLPSLGLPDVPAKRLPRPRRRAASAIMLVGFAEGLGAAKTYAARDHYEIDANRELIGLGAANLGAGLVERDGRQRQPVEDRRQRRRRAPGRRSPALVVAAMTIAHAAVPDRPVREAAGGDARRGRHRRGDRAGRLPRAPRGCYGRRRRAGRRLGVAARPDFVAAVAALLGVLVFDTLPGLVHRHRRLAAAAALPRLAPARRDARQGAGRRPPVGRPRAPPRERRDARGRRCCGSRAASSSRTPTPSARHGAGGAAAREGVHAVVLDAETVPFVDVSAARHARRRLHRGARARTACGW